MRLHDDRAVREFVEKPTADQIDTNLISAGAYVLERSVLDLIPPDRNVSIEREIWPRLVGDGLYGFPAEAYWLDIGTPERYLQGTFDILEGNVAHRRCATGSAPGYLAVVDGVEADGRVVPPAIVERGCRIERGRARRQPRRARRGRAGRRGLDDRARRRPERRRDRPGLRAARLHRRRRRAHRPRAPWSRAARSSARASPSVSATCSRAACESFRRRTLPDGAITF